MPTNRVIEVSYELMVPEEGGMVMVERTSRDKPFRFISGLGFALDAFENKIVPLEPGAKFEFIVPKDEAYGDYLDEHVIELDRNLFVIDGKFDELHIYPGNVIPLQNEDGTRFEAIVEEVGTDKVTVNLNHPLAGRDLHFKGTVIINREASTKEVEDFIMHMTGDECDCDHEHCDCEHEHCDHDHKHGDGHCGCGHCH